MILLLNRYRFFLRAAVYLVPSLAFAVALAATAWFREWHNDLLYEQISDSVYLLLFTTAVWIGLAEHYTISSVEELLRERTGIRAAFAACVSTCAIDLTTLFLVKGQRISRLFFLLSAFLLLVLTLLVHALFRRLVRSQAGRRKPLRVFMVGTDQFARRAVQRLRQTPFPCTVAGYLHLPDQQVVVRDAPVHELEHVDGVDFSTVNDIVIAVPASRLAELPVLISKLELTCRPIRAIVDLGQNIIIREKLFQFGRLQLLDLATTPAESLRYSIVKRLFDIVFSTVSIAISAPLMVLIAVAIKLTSPGPIIFRQARVGLNGQVFSMLKFRTMRVALPNESDKRWTTKNDPRCSRIGLLLRKASLDELPQFFNVLKGDMSVVGPRPERPHFVHSFLQNINAYNKRHALRVGITGWAQVNGWRGDTSIEKRIECDLYYLQNWSLAFDLRIIFLTLWSGLFGRNAY